MLALNTVYNMDCVEGLANLDDGSINSCVTSPPYWSHRRYDIDSVFGMEPTPQEYVANLVKVFRDVRRVLRDDGVLWLNLGDTYAGSWGNAGHRPELDGTPPISGPRIRRIPSGKAGTIGGNGRRQVTNCRD